MLKHFYSGIRFIFGILILHVLFSQNLNAQGFYEYNWYFGSSSEAIIFNKFDDSPFVVNDQGLPFANGGSAVATDPISGQLLFYSDGLNIYDASHQIMVNGAGVGVVSKNQSVAISPVPGAVDKFYVITNSANYNAGGTVNYSIVDMTLPGNSTGGPALGAVEAANKTVAAGINDTSEGMIVVAGGTPTKFWLIIQDQTIVTHNIRAYSIGAGGSFVETSFAVIPSQTLAANFSFSAAAGKIAVSPQEDNKNIILLNFDFNTGAISMDQTILNTFANDGFAGEAIYDTEWSADGTKLYISRHGNAVAPLHTGNLYQYDLNNPVAPVSLIGNTIYRSFGLKLAPDNNIYHLFQSANGNPIQLAQLTFADSIADSVQYLINPLAATQFAAQQFPEFAYPQEKMLDPITFSYLDSCQNALTKFFPQFSDNPQPQNFNWDFGDGSNSTMPVPTHLYDAPGSYTVTLEIQTEGDIETFSSAVQILANNLMINLGNDTTICPGETLLLNPNPQGASGALTYGWSTTETTETITIDSAGTYWVVVKDAATGCDAYDAIQVKVYGDENQTANFWYFGNNAGIDFNQMPAVALSDGAQTAPEGVATISDANGDLLFYTDGQTVYDRNHAVMGNGTDIGGNPGSTQSSIIIPFPADETMFYIFTTDDVHGDGTYNLNYAVVDLKENAPIGLVVKKNKPLYTKSTEKLAAILGGGGAWLMSHEFGNNTFRAYPIDSTGIGSPVLSAIGLVHNSAVALNGRGQMKFSGGKLAVTVPGNPNYVEVFDFDSNTGEVSNPLQIDLMEAAPAFAYGVDFSAGGTKLFVTVNLGNGNSKLMEYAFDSLRTEVALISVPPLDVAASLGSIQIGPDGQMYVAVDGASSLGVISPNEDSATVSPFTVDQFALAGGTTSGLGLPNFVQSFINPPMQPSMAFTQACVGQETLFLANGTSDIDEYLWSFGDGGSSSEQNPTHTYPAAGSYNLQLNISNRCGFDTTLVGTVEVFAPPSAADTAVAICNTDVLISATSDLDPTLSFFWATTGETTRQITVAQPGAYDVTIANTNGCDTTVTITVVDGRPVTDLGNDQILCQNDVVPDLDAQNPGAAFIWRKDGVDLGNNSRQQPIDTSVPGNFQYIVSVTDPITFCERLDTVNVLINPEPNVTVTPTNTTGCGLSDGTISFAPIGLPSTYSYTVTGPQNANGSNVNGPRTIPSLQAGTYLVTVVDDLTGCVNNIGSIVIEDGAPDFTITGTPMVPDDCSGNGTVTIDLSTALAYPITYKVFDDLGVEIQNGVKNAPDAGNGFVVTNLAEGNYTFEVTSTGGCVQTAIQNVTKPAELVFSISGPTDVCGSGQLQILDNLGNLNGNLSAIWSTNTGNIQGPVNQLIINVDQIGTHKYYVTVSDNLGLLCPAKDSIEVTVQEELKVGFRTTGDVCDGRIALTAFVKNPLPGESFTFDWADGSLPDIQTVILTNDVPPAAKNYGVTVRGNLRVCTKVADTTVLVKEPLEVTVISELACGNGNPVRLIANSPQAGVAFSWAYKGTTLGFDTPEILVVDEGLYTVSVAKDGCTKDASLNMTRLPFPQPTLPEKPVICAQDTDPDKNSVALDGGDGFSAYQWSLNGTVVATSQTYTAVQEGIYIIKLTDGFGCENEFETEVVEDCTPTIAAPNAFSPNGNGQNETFKMFPIFVTKFEIQIYNRWGELVYQSTDKNFQWDGTKKGKALPIGTYAYVVRFSSEYDKSGREYVQRGGVTIVK